MSAAITADNGVKIYGKTHLKASCRDEALRILAGMLRKSGCVKDSFLQAILDRESKFPTGLVLEGPVNVALAHADTKHVIESGFAVGVLDEPVQFHNMAAPEELVDVHVIFVMAAQDPKTVMRALQHLTQDIFQRKDVMSAIFAADDDSELEQYLDRIINSSI